MNDEHVPRHGDEESTSTPRSRWAVSPGSVDDGFGRRHVGDDDSTPRRRSAREIIDEVTSSRSAPDDYPTRVSVRRPDVPFEMGTKPRLDPNYGDAPDATKGDRRVRAPRRAPLIDESTRVEPELGEKRELTPVAAPPSGRMVMAGFGGVILIAIGGLIGAIVDYLFVDRLGIVTAVGLTLGAALAALVTRKRDLLSIIVAPPLVYAVLAGLVLLLSAKEIRITGIADAAIRGFPAMALATGVAALIAGVRLVMSKKGQRS